MSELNDKPLVTFALFAYNQEKLIREAVEGAFAQDYSPLEIILSDDCSTDRTFEIMCEMVEAYSGPHTIVLNRNQENLNIADHLNKIGAMASGELIVLAAGDDISASRRTSLLKEHWRTLAESTAYIYSDFQPIDKYSKIVTLENEAVYLGVHSIEKMARGDIPILGATAALTKDLFTKFKPMESGVRHEDRVLPFRVFLLRGVISHINEKLVKYRVEGGISRVTAISAYDYLYGNSQSVLMRTLPDAIQRLADLDSLTSKCEAIRKLCLGTISDYNVILSMLGGGIPNVYPSFIRALSKSSNPRRLFTYYIKIKYFYIYDKYYKFRYK